MTTLTYAIDDGRLSLTLVPLTVDLPIWCLPAFSDVCRTLGEAITLGPLAMDLAVGCFPTLGDIVDDVVTLGPLTVIL